MKSTAVAAALLLGLPAAAFAQHAHGQGAQATYATKAEAEKAARLLHCSGAHPMGDRWMPCSSHGEGHASGH